MKTGKKFLSVLLSLVLLLSFGALALAEGDAEDYNWTPLPTSADGLEDGTYYVDFTKFTAYFSDEDMSPEEKEEMLAMYNSGEFFFDEERLVFKETITVPASMTGADEDQIVTLQDFIENDGLEIFFVCLREAGAQWYPVAKSTEGLQNGDWYVDLSAADEETRARLESSDIYINPNGKLEKYLVVPADLQGLEYTGDFFPLITRYAELVGPWMGVEDPEVDPYAAWPSVCPVQQYVAPEAPDEPEQQTTNPFQDFIASVKAFVRSILSFFRRMFG